MGDHNGHREPATPEEIWNILREVAESQKETDRRMQQTDRQMQRTDRQLQETRQLLERQGRETDLRLRKLDELFNGQWGKLMESLVEGDLVKLLAERGMAVDHTINNPKKNYGPRRWEFDILAVDGREVVVVEVKTTLKVDDVDYFVERLQDFPELMPEYGVRRPASVRRGGVPQVTRVGERARRTAGSVRDPCYRQQRQHYQRRRVHAACLRSPDFGPRRLVARPRQAANGGRSALPTPVPMPVALVGRHNGTQ